MTLSGCASSGVTTSSVAYAENITPIQNTPVASSNLPAIGANGQMVATPGQPTDLNAPAALNPSMQASATPGGLTPQPGVTDQFGNPLVASVAPVDGTFVSTDSVGSVPQTQGRDLSGGLSYEKLLGGWTIVAGADQCRLNLTYTAKTGTSRYRASTPGCGLTGLKVVASWALAGSQVQLYDENGDIVANLLLSGGRFIGTLAGGTSISMV
ncbi:MAG: hypothetical protein EOO74_11195 [Myxococcales bacterium]|nr:MAG: hypothetical protein EOO74_11195 [Myxococcales bacterium]